MITTHQRDLLGVYMDYLVAHAAKTHYSLHRPNPCAGIHTMAQLKAHIESEAGIECDCSGSVSLLCHLAGLTPPSGPKYGWSWGDTETIGAYLHRYSDPREAHTGAMIWFNYTLPLSKQHITMVRHPGTDPVVFTQGGENDPHFRKLSWMKPGFTNFICLSVKKL